MRKKGSVFRFKQFSVSHERSSMKIGVDAVLLGAWADIENASIILDVGTGCGVIALMCAQRNKNALVDAIDIDSASVEEAEANFSASPWKERLSVKITDFMELSGSQQFCYDYILSNPPYFDAGISDPDTSRLMARHQHILSPKSLIINSLPILKDGGRIALVMPSLNEADLLESLRGKRIRLIRRLLVQGHPGVAYKRVLLEFEKGETFEFNSGCLSEEPIPTRKITLENPPGTPTQEYIELEKEFYLKF